MRARFPIAIFTAAAVVLGCGGETPKTPEGEPRAAEPEAPAIEQASTVEKTIVAQLTVDKVQRLVEVGYLELLRSNGAQQALRLKSGQHTALSKIQDATGVKASATERHQAERELVSEFLSAAQLEELDRLYAAMKCVTTSAGPENLGLVTTKEQNAQLEHLRKKWGEQAERLRRLAEQMQGEQEDGQSVIEAITKAKHETMEHIVKILAQMFATQTKPTTAGQKN